MLASSWPMKEPMHTIATMTQTIELSRGEVDAIAVSLIAGGIQPLMTRLIGQAFNSMANFPASSPTEADKHHLLRTMAFVSLELVGLAVGSLVLSSVMSGLWFRVGEITVMRVRNKVFQAVVKRDIEWFDALGVSDTEKGSEGIGAGGLMAKFTRCVIWTLLVSMLIVIVPL